MNDKEVVIWLDRRWYDALNKHLKGETLEEHLEEVIEAMGTKYGVVKTELAGRGWTHWLQIEYINYD